MKRILSLLLAALLIGTLAACQKPPVEQPVESGDPTDTTAPVSVDTTAPVDPTPGTEPVSVEGVTILSDDGTVTVKAVSVPTENFRLLPPVREMMLDDEHLLVLLWNEDETGAVTDLQLSVLDAKTGEFTRTSVPLDSTEIPGSAYRAPNALYLLAYDFSDPENVRRIGWRVTGEWYDLKVTSMTEADVEEFLVMHDANTVFSPDGDFMAWQRTTTDPALDGLYLGNAANAVWHLKETHLPEEGYSLGEVRGYRPVGFIDEITLVYQITGWEWSCGYGYCDVLSGKCTDVENGRAVLAVGDGFLYTADVSSYSYKNVYKEYPDGTEELLASAETNTNEAIAPLFKTDMLTGWEYTDELCALFCPTETDALQLTVLDADLTTVHLTAEIEPGKSPNPFWFFYEDTCYVFHAAEEK